YRGDGRTDDHADHAGFVRRESGYGQDCLQSAQKSGALYAGNHSAEWHPGLTQRHRGCMSEDHLFEYAPRMDLARFVLNTSGPDETSLMRKNAFVRALNEESDRIKNTREYPNQKLSQHQAKMRRKVIREFIYEQAKNAQRLGVLTERQAVPLLARSHKQRG